MKNLQLHRHANLLAGFFVASALIVFGVGAFVLAYKKGVFEKTYVLNASFESGLGLRQGTDVQFNGVKIGRVESLELMPVSSGPKSAGRVLLKLALDTHYREFLTTHTVAFAERDKNLVSDRVINLEMSKLGGRVLDHNDTLRVTDSRDIETVIGLMTHLAGKMDTLLDNVGALVETSRDSNTTIGALLGSRVVYNRILSGLSHVDTAVTEGRHVLGRVNRLGDTLYEHVGPLLARADTTTLSLQHTAREAERLGGKANLLADRGDVILRRVDQVLLQGAGKIDQAGDLMNAISKIWFIHSKLEPPSEFPVLLNTAGP